MLIRIVFSKLTPYQEDKLNSDHMNYSNLQSILSGKKIDEKHILFDLLPMENNSVDMFMKIFFQTHWLLKDDLILILKIIFPTYYLFENEMFKETNQDILLNLHPIEEKI